MKKKLFTSALLVLLALCFLLTACGQTAASPSATAAPASAEATAAPATAEAGAKTVDIVDALGRTVTIPTPENLQNVYSDSTAPLVPQYIIAYDLMTASPTTFTADKDAPFVNEKVYDLPFYGTMSGSNGSLNYEAIKAGNVQLILTSVFGNATDADKEEADALQAQLNIPVVAICTDLDKVGDTFTLLGKIFGRETQAAEITAYFNSIVERVTTLVAGIADDKKPTLYYAEGADGLSTEPATSARSIVFNMCGAKNIAEAEALSGFGQASVSMEQVLSWNPQVIIVQSGTGAYDIITTDASWANIDAVKNGRVYEMPGDPFSWADRPPSDNRFIGLLWLANLLYPEDFSIDMVTEAIDYYKTIYHVEVTAEDMQKLLTNSTMKLKK